MIYFLILLPFLLVAVWFRNGLLMGAGESGLPFYNLNIASDNSKWAWADALVGNANGINVASHPTYYILSKLESLGIPNFLIQAVFIYIVLVVAGFSIVYLTKILFPKVENEILVVTTFFYLFNPFAAVNVWNRFLYNFMVFYALFPLVLALFIQGIKKKNYLYSIYIGFSCVLFSYSLTSVSSVILLLGTLIFTCFFWSLLGKTKKDVFYNFSFLLITLIVFTLLNFWWLSQLFTFVSSSSYSTSVSSFFTTSGNFFNLSALSQRLGQFIFTIRFMHKDFYANDLWWSKVFAFPFVVFLEFFVSGLILWAIYKGRKKAEVLFLSSLFVISLFLIKGNQPPFGEVFLFFFDKFKQLQVFRNPFEKIGFLLVLIASPLFAFGVNRLGRWSKGLVYFTIVVIWGLPFWTGHIFHSKDVSGKEIVYQTQVPDYYKEADEWLRENSDGYRFISLPLGGEGVTHTWEKSYSGVESSSALFNTPNISLNTSVPYINDEIPMIEKALVQGEGIERLMPLLNAKYIVLRNDIDWRQREMRDPNLIETALDENDNFKIAKKFGALTIYAVDEKFLQPTISISTNTEEISPSPQMADIFTKGGDSSRILIPQGVLVSNNTSPITKSMTRSYISNTKNLSLDQTLATLPYARFLPTHPLFGLVLIKENAERSFASGGKDQFLYDLSRLGKRAVETYRLSIANSDLSMIESSAKRYFAEMEEMEKLYPDYLKIDPSNEFLGLVVENLLKHNTLFREISISKNIPNPLEKKIIDLGIESQYPILIEGENGYRMFRFKVEKDGFYDLGISNFGFDKFYESPKNQFEIQINDIVYSISLKENNGRFLLGKFFFDQGINQVIIGNPSPLYISGEEQYTLDSDSNPELKFQVEPFDPYGTYKLSFDYWIKKGKGSNLSLIYDNSPIDVPGGLVTNIKDDGYNHNFANYSFIFIPRNGANKMYIKLKAEPENVCPKRIVYLLNSCKNDAFRNMFNKKTEVEIKNMKIEKLFNEEMFLLGNAASSQEINIPRMSFRKINPTKYEVEISGARGQYVLVFSELYNDQWKIVPEKGESTGSEKHFLTNGYSNGWLIDKEGNYSFKIIYAPQSVMEKGLKISQVSFLVFLVLLGIIKWKRS